LSPDLTNRNYKTPEGTHPVTSQNAEMLVSITTADWAPEIGAFCGMGPLLSRTAALTDGILIKKWLFHSYWSRQTLTPKVVITLMSLKKSPYSQLKVTRTGEKHLPFKSKKDSRSGSKEQEDKSKMSYKTHSMNSKDSL
jgi:hypothetical protein